MTSSDFILIVTCNPKRPILTTPMLSQLASACHGTLHHHHQDIAAEFAVPSSLNISALRSSLADMPVDINMVPANNRRKKLLLADMDSTILSGESLDELAAHTGLHDTIAAITARAMNGEISFKDALFERVAMLKGLPVSAIGETLARMTYTDGAAKLVRTMRDAGAFTALASGGFTPFTDAVQKALGFHEQRANHLETDGDILTGTVAQPIFDRAGKRAYLNELVERLAITLDDTIAVGDGANDLEMLKAAGMGVAFRAKPAVQAEASLIINHGDLTALLYLQGIYP